MEGVKTRRAEYAEQTRAALLDAAAEAFAQDGFTATSITQIASSARVTKGAVYHHFPDKHHLFAAVLDQYNESAQQQVYDAIGKHPTDPWQAALAGLEATLDVCMDSVGTAGAIPKSTTPDATSACYCRPSSTPAFTATTSP
jgi:AcrR family transcriptional regulator